MQNGAHANAAFVLAIDNAKLASDDFRVKYDDERAMHLSVKAHISGLKRVLDKVTPSRAHLEIKVGGFEGGADPLEEEP
ncbi:keratin, type I cytoskeletal 19-like [Dunckerocampus dactyliophorus]|uniref:keratin, type I cytoskeletal 19-like n=1 Tax=Dunckerocampus dactyliophorus TaxID=161453 RepID=UPI002406AD0B|nr:keratin, type I cytoskeletal 19-like [Dunckerocampus dactyliophorus]